MFPIAQYSLILAVARFLNFYQCGSYQMVFCYSFSSCFPESPTGLSIVLCVLMSLAILISSSANCLLMSFSFPLKLSFLTDCRSYSYTLDFFFQLYCATNTVSHFMACLFTLCGIFLMTEILSFSIIEFNILS